VLGTAGKFVLHRAGITRSPLFNPDGRKLGTEKPS
jgi:hypothetical protein